jgi:hypothetical protein
VRAVIAATIAAFLVSAIDCSAASFPTMLVGGDPNRLRNNSQVVGLVCAPNVTIKHIAAFGIMGTITHESRTAREHLKNALVVSVLGEERVSPDDAREPRFPGTPAKDEWRDDAPP